VIIPSTLSPVSTRTAGRYLKREKKGPNRPSISLEISKVCVAGLGTVGLPTAMYMADKGMSVRGYDINKLAVKRAEGHGIQSSTTLRDLDVDAIVVCVGTNADGMRPVIGPVSDVIRKVGKMRFRAPLISIESTMPPGSCRVLCEKYLPSSVLLVHVPHRYWEGDPVNHGVRQLRVIGAINQRSLDAGVEFYEDRLEIPLHRVDSIEIAEASKVLENAYRFVQIAFAEESKLILASAGIDFDATRVASNTKWNVEIPEARNGIGGHCLPKDVRYLASLDSKHPLVDGAMISDHEYSRRFETPKPKNRFRGARRAVLE